MSEYREAGDEIEEDGRSFIIRFHPLLLNIFSPYKYRYMPKSTRRQARDTISSSTL